MFVGVRGFALRLSAVSINGVLSWEGQIFEHDAVGYQAIPQGTSQNEAEAIRESRGLLAGVSRNV